MLHQEDSYQMDQQTYNCDTISSTSSCLTTPFSVKDILNLNMTQDSEYLDNNVPYLVNAKEQSYHQYDDAYTQHWENPGLQYHQPPSYESYGYNYYVDQSTNASNNNCGRTVESCYGDYVSMTSHVQQLSNFCVPYPENKTKETGNVTMETESTSKQTIFVYSYNCFNNISNTKSYLHSQF